MIRTANAFAAAEIVAAICVPSAMRYGFARNAPKIATPIDAPSCLVAVEMPEVMPEYFLSTVERITEVAIGVLETTAQSDQQQCQCHQRIGEASACQGDPCGADQQDGRTRDQKAHWMDHVREPSGCEVSHRGKQCQRHHRKTGSQGRVAFALQKIEVQHEQHAKKSGRP